LTNIKNYKETNCFFKFCFVNFEDIVTMTVFIDVNALGGQMPHFVAADPDKLPSQSLSTGDLQCVLNKFHVLTDQIQSIQDSVTESSLSLTSKMVTVLHKVSNNRLSNLVPVTQPTSQFTTFGHKSHAS